MLAGNAVWAVQPGIPDRFPEKKLIAAGWDSPTPEELVGLRETIEKLPFDGIRISVSVPTPDGKSADFYRIMTPEKWEKAWFQEAVQNLQKAKSERLTENFLSVGAGLEADWFDDAAWQNITEHFRIAAWVAREGGLRGIMFNPEVGVRQPAFSYNRQVHADKYSFAEYAAKIRQRAAELMKAMAEEYPDMVFFSMFLNGGQAYSSFYQHPAGDAAVHHWYWTGGALVPSGPKTPAQVQEQLAPLEMIEGGSYNLLPAFLNGLLDAVPPGMVIVDGLEQTYTTTARERFVYWAHNVHTMALPLVAPENRRKYRSQVEAGFGIYLNPYINPPGSKYYIKPEKEGQNRLEILKRSVRNALEVSDRYVWLWGERHWWWPVQRKRLNPESFEEIAPGITKAIELARNPAREAGRMYQKAERRLKASSLENLFSDAAGRQWHLASTGGTVNTDPSAGQEGVLRLSGAPEVIAQTELSLQRKRGIYAIRVRVREEGAAASIRVRWRKDDGPLLHRLANAIRLMPEKREEGSEWGVVEGIVAAPPGSNKMVIQVIAREEQPGGTAWFGDFEVFPVEL